MTIPSWHPEEKKVGVFAELRFRSSRTARLHCTWEGEGEDLARADVQKVITMLELMLDTFDEPSGPVTPPSEYGDQPDDPDAGVFEREPEPPEGLDEPGEPDQEKRE